MTALPGTPSIQNALPIPYYGTNVFAALGLGLIAAAIMLLGGLWWLWGRAANARLAGEGYGNQQDDTGLSAVEDLDSAALSHMPLLLALLPLVLVISVNALFTYVVFPRMDMSFVTERFPHLTPAKVIGLWALIIALVTACATLIVSRLGHWDNLRMAQEAGISPELLHRVAVMAAGASIRCRIVGRSSPCWQSAI